MPLNSENWENGELVSFSLSPNSVSNNKKTDFVQSKCAHKTIQKPSLDSPILWHVEHGNDVGETVWAEPHTSQGLLKGGVHEGRPMLQPSGSQTSLHMGSLSKAQAIK